MQVGDNRADVGFEKSPENEFNKIRLKISLISWFGKQQIDIP